LAIYSWFLKVFIVRRGATKLRQCFRRRNNLRRDGDGDEKTAKRADEVGTGDNVALATVATVDNVGDFECFRNKAAQR